MFRFACSHFSVFSLPSKTLGDKKYDDLNEQGLNPRPLTPQATDLTTRPVILGQRLRLGARVVLSRCRQANSLDHGIQIFQLVADVV